MGALLLVGATNAPLAYAEQDPTEWEKNVDWALPASLVISGVQPSTRGASVPPETRLKAEWVRPPAPGRHSVRLRSPASAPSFELWAVVQIRAVQFVWVAERMMAAGERLQVGDLRRERQLVGTPASRPMSGDLRLVGRRLARRVLPGEVIADRDLEIAPATPRGARVLVNVPMGRLTVTAPATLEQSLRPGQSGRARLVESKRVVMGVLAEDGTFLIGGES